MSIIYRTFGPSIYIIKFIFEIKKFEFSSACAKSRHNNTILIKLSYRRTSFLPREAQTREASCPVYRPSFCPSSTGPDVMPLCCALTLLSVHLRQLHETMLHHNNSLYYLDLNNNSSFVLSKINKIYILYKYGASSGNFSLGLLKEQRNEFQFFCTDECGDVNLAQNLVGTSFLGNLIFSTDNCCYSQHEVCNSTTRQVTFIIFVASIVSR
jgi:hypothetical protein